MNGAFRKIINHLTSLALSFDGVTVEVKTFTQPSIFGPGVMYSDQPAGVVFYTTSSELIQRIKEALDSPGGLPTPPPNEGTLKSYT